MVEGLDLTTMAGLTSEGSVTWSDQLVQVLGTVEGEVLTTATPQREPTATPQSTATPTRAPSGTTDAPLNEVELRV